MKLTTNQLINFAIGKTPAELLLKNGRLINVYSGEIFETNVLIHQGIIIGIGQEYFTAQKTIDLNGLYIMPGLIEGHIHIESSLLNPTEFARLLLLAGTTTVVCDPHEIANVLGTKGIDYILNCSKNLPLDIFMMIPSCVPSTDKETAGGRITAQDIKKYLANPRVLGLAEMMNFPGVIHAVPEVLEKIDLTRQANKIIDGHAPRLYGKYLQAYALAGITSDHECIDPKEALEKMRAGMRIMIREGSGAKNLSDLKSMVNIRNSRRCFFVSDDKHPDELLSQGHLNATLRKAVALGIDPISAIQMATLNTAEYFNLKDRGALSPGKIADITVIDNLTDFNVIKVFKNGKEIVADKKLNVSLPYFKDKAVLNTMKVKPFTIDKLQIKIKPRMDTDAKRRRSESEPKHEKEHPVNPVENSVKLNVIRLIPNQIVTEKWSTTISSEQRVASSEQRAKNQKPKTKNHKRFFFDSDTERDILKLVVVERHKKTGNIGIGFVSGFGLKKGAIASSVAHDSHNLIAVGTNDKDIYSAIKQLVKIGGGFVAIDKAKVKAELALPIAGLMSDDKAENVSRQLKELLQVVKLWGCKIDNPFIALSFLALPVIPELKLTDQGLFDVTKFKTIGLFE